LSDFSSVSNYSLSPSLSLSVSLSLQFLAIFGAQY